MGRCSATTATGVASASRKVGTGFRTRCAQQGNTAEVAQDFLAGLLALKQVKTLLSAEYFSVDGTLIEAWASMKSFRPKDGSGSPPDLERMDPGSNGERDFHGEKRSNDTHVSSTDPDARLF